MEVDNFFMCYLENIINKNGIFDCYFENKKEKLEPSEREI